LPYRGEHHVTINNKKKAGTLGTGDFGDIVVAF
jgi:hypothetical protein